MCFGVNPAPSVHEKVAAANVATQIQPAVKTTNFIILKIHFILVTNYTTGLRGPMQVFLTPYKKNQRQARTVSFHTFLAEIGNFKVKTDCCYIDNTGAEPTGYRFRI